MTQEEFVFNNEITDTDFLIESFFEFFPSYKTERNTIFFGMEFSSRKNERSHAHLRSPIFFASAASGFDSRAKQS